MQKILVFLLFYGLLFGATTVFAQDLKTDVTKNKELDSLRKKEEKGTDSTVFNSKYIRYTTHKLTKDSIQTIPIDTGLTGIQNFSVIAQPRRPTAGTGVLGLAARPLLFEPVKTIGFDAGFHALDYYMMNHEDVKFYRARSPYTNLYYVNAGDKEQVLKLLHTQNVTKNWNFGANFNRIGANGAYAHQRGDDLNAAVFTWYQSQNKRYTLWLDGVFNTLKAEENGSPVNDTIFSGKGSLLIEKLAEPVRLSTARQLWRKNSWMLKQSYFVGRIDSTGKSASQQSILPTNKITYTLAYTRNDYSFKKDEIDVYKVLPYTAVDSVFTNDSTNVKHVMNEFVYTFFLRAKGNSLIKNELKIDAGIRHDFYKYAQYGLLKDRFKFYTYETSFQNISLLGSLGYRFSNKVDFNLNLQQIFQGENTGDFLYEGKSNLLLGKNVGRIVLGAYLQNKSPEQLFNRYYGNHYNWDNKFGRTKTANVSFSYLNDKYNLDATASYYLITNHLYFISDAASSISPTQENGDISLLKISLGKKFTLRTWHLDAYAVYQKTDNENVLRIPEIYTFSSLYKDQTFFKTLKTQIGFDVRYNTSYLATAYSPAASQFYNIDEKLSAKPVVDVWIKAGLRRANLFLKYEYLNQGLFEKGYYTVKEYPMPDKLLRFGVSWNFYD